VLDDVLPKRYKKDSSYGTTFLYEPSALDLYVLKKPGEPGDERDESTGTDEDRESPESGAE